MSSSFLVGAQCVKAFQWAWGMTRKQGPVD
jgi:hypothetical protein